MEKRITLIAIATGAGLMVSAQGPNLVKNPGFEELSKPVTTWDQLSRATGWSNANIGTCDVFDKTACYTNVPDNDLGTGTPAYEGERYAGFVAYKEDMRQNWKSRFHYRLRFQTSLQYIRQNLNYPFNCRLKFQEFCRYMRLS